MIDSGNSPKRFAIAAHPSLKDASQQAEIIANVLKNLGAEIVEYGSIYDDRLKQQLLSGSYDVLIALGGDGTILRAGHLCAQPDVPILGINMGRFGFLTEVQNREWESVLPDLLQGKYRVEQRMMLWAEHQRNNEILGGWDVLNEVVVCRGAYVRPILLEASLDGYRLSSYVADGLIVATPTGSTAYALAAGGPIMPPELRNILIIPVAPHLSMDRAIILQEGATVTVVVHSAHQPVISVDGHPPVTLDDGDSVVVSMGRHAVKFIRFQDPGYFYRNLSLYMEQNPITGASQ